MKNPHKSLILPALAILLALALASCASSPPVVVMEETSGLLVITGFPPEFNHRYLFASNERYDNPRLYAFDSLDASGNRAATAVIENGSATLKVWQNIRTQTGRATETKWANYSRDDQADLYLTLMSSRTFNPLGGYSMDGALGRITVNFAGGRAAYDYNYVASPETGGRLTITNLSAQYNGKYIFAQGYVGRLRIFAAASLNRGYVSGGVVENGSVTLKVWQGYGRMQMRDYSGNDKVVMLVSTIIEDERERFLPGSYHSEQRFGERTVTFTNGKAVISVR